MEEARNFIYQQIRHFKHGVGHAIHWQGIWLAAANEPPHVQERWKDVGEELITEGLIEKRENGEFLTQKGYDEIWGLNQNSHNPVGF